MKRNYKALRLQTSIVLIVCFVYNSYLSMDLSIYLSSNVVNEELERDIS